MNDFVKHIQKVERSISSEKGEFNLFALFLRENSLDKWDLLIAAPWVERNKSDALKRISKEIQQNLTKKEMLKLSRLVIIDKSNPALSAFQKAIDTEHGDAEIKDSNFFGLQIKHAHVITSRRVAAA